MRRNWMFVVLAMLFAAVTGLWASPANADCVVDNGASDNASCSVSDVVPSGAVAPNTGTYNPEGGVLYDNGPIYNVPGTPAFSRLQDASLLMSLYGFGHAVSSGFRVADDFTVPAGQTWTVTGAEFFAYQTGSTTTSTINNVNLRIWDGVPGAGGSTVVFGDTTTNRLSATAWDNGYRDLESAPGNTQRPIMVDTATVSVSLPAGTYWIDWQTGGTLGSGPWVPPITINGQATTGNGLQFDPTAGTWNPALDAGSATPQGLPFRILGTGGGGGDGIALDKTVGTTAGVCAATDTINVPVGTDVYYCYEVTNNSAVTLSLHTLDDSELGNIFGNFAYDLGPGDSVSTVDAGLEISTTITTDTTNVGTWTAFNPVTYDIITGTCTFPEIAATGTALNLGDDDVADVTLPFSFPFYEINTTQMSVSNNGVVTFGATGSGQFSNEPLPSAAIPNSHAVFWDDLDAETGNVYHGPFTYTLASGVNSLENANGLLQGNTTYYVVQYDDRSHFPGPSASGITVAVGYIESGQGLDGYSFSCYPDTDFGDPATNNGASATIGLNQDATNALQYSFNTPRPELTGNFGIGWMPIGGGEVFTATDMATVTVTGPEINVTPASVTETHNPFPQTTNRTVTVQNTGNASLVYTVTEENGVTFPGILRKAQGGAYVHNGGTVTLPKNGDGTAFTRSGVTGATTYNSPNLVAGSLFITHSSTQNITTGNSVACNAGGLHTDNSYFRVYDLAGDFGITQAIDVDEVSFGVEQALGASGSQPVTVNLYTLVGPLNTANLTLIGSEAVSVPDSASGTVYAVPFSPEVTVPANAILVVEVFTPNGQTTGNSFFIGSNADPETDPSYLMAADCGVAQPATTGSIGFPNMHIVMNVSAGLSACNAATDIPWLTVSPTSGTIPAAGSTNLTLTFNSTGLVAGTYEGNVCVASTDYDEPIVPVPVTLIVGGPTAVDLSSIGTAGNTTPLVVFAAAGMLLLAAVGLVMRKR